LNSLTDAEVSPTSVEMDITEILTDIHLQPLNISANNTSHDSIDLKAPATEMPVAPPEPGFRKWMAAMRNWKWKELAKLWGFFIGAGAPIYLQHLWFSKLNGRTADPTSPDFNILSSQLWVSRESNWAAALVTSLLGLGMVVAYKQFAWWWLGNMKDKSQVFTALTNHHLELILNRTFFKKFKFGAVMAFLIG